MRPETYARKAELHAARAREQARRAFRWMVVAAVATLVTLVAQVVGP